MQPSGLDAYVLEEVFEKDELATGVVITFQVMAVAGVSPGDPDAVCPVPKGGQKKLRGNAAGARHANDPYVGGVLEPAHPGQVGGPVSAPVA